MSNSFIHSNIKAVNSFIRQTIKDNPEPFRGYQEISAQTVSLASKKQQMEKEMKSNSMLLLESASVDIEDLL